MRVSSLKKLCDIIGIGFDELESKGMISINGEIKFPIRLDVPEFTTLIAAATNEGHLETGKYLFEYYNKDLILHEIVRRCVLYLFGKGMTKPEPKGHALRSYSYGIVARALLKSGVMLGSKSLANLQIPQIICDGGLKLWKPYSHQIMSEEMNFHFRIKKGKYLSLVLKYGRSVDITNVLSHYVNRIRVRERLPFSSFSDNDRNVIHDNPPLLLMNEKYLLSSLNINCYPKPKYVYKTSKQKLKAHWILYIEKIESLKLFYKYFATYSGNGILPLKMNEFFEKFNFWKNHRGKPLSEEEFLQLRKIIEKWRKIKRKWRPSVHSPSSVSCKLRCNLH